MADTLRSSVAGLVEHPADGGGLGVLHLAGLHLLVQVGDEQRERGALADAVDHPGERFDVAELRASSIRPSSPAIRWRSSAIASVTSALGRRARRARASCS